MIARTRVEQLVPSSASDIRKKDELTIADEKNPDVSPHSRRTVVWRTGRKGREGGVGVEERDSEEERRGKDASDACVCSPA